MLSWCSVSHLTSLTTSASSQCCHDALSVITPHWQLVQALSAVMMLRQSSHLTDNQCKLSVLSWCSASHLTSLTTSASSQCCHDALPVISPHWLLVQALSAIMMLCQSSHLTNHYCMLSELSWFSVSHHTSLTTSASSHSCHDAQSVITPHWQLVQALSAVMMLCQSSHLTDN